MSSKRDMQEVIDTTNTPNIDTPRTSPAAATRQHPTVIMRHNPYKKTPPKAVTASSASPTTAKAVVNPYRQKKRAGGYEVAFQNSRKATTQRLMTPADQAERLREVIPSNVKPFDRFFGALLRSSANDYALAFGDSTKEVRLWTTVCQRLGLTVPKQAIQSRYNNPADHFSIRAALVVEESRHMLSQEISRSTCKVGRSSLSIMTSVASHYSERSGKQSMDSTKVTFHKCTKYAKEELFHIRNGSIFRCFPRDGPQSLQDSWLGVVCKANRDETIKTHGFQLQFFLPLPLFVGSEWVCSPVGTLMTEFRSFDAMTSNPHRIPFLPQLLTGQCDKKASHVHVEETNIKDSFGAAESQRKSAYRKKVLNPAQDKAMMTFLESPANSITLIQGPPGTGKTTLLVQVICRYLEQSLLAKQQGKPGRGRLMVCAPTNKAISVLASRFLAAVNQDEAECTVLLVGDADKLLVDERSSNDPNSSNTDAIELRTTLLYTWVKSIIADYRKIKSDFTENSCWCDPTQLRVKALRLERRLRKCYASFPPDLEKLVKNINDALESLKRGDPTHSIVDLLDNLMSALETISVDDYWRHLLSSANVIFCTLASAGGAVFKNTKHINDLIVDEAAAATEPELYIPFHLCPTRLLAVGDPLQLPATVRSRRAVKLGLDKSLHERLMYGCDFDYVMLDEQYRMRPDISAFPSQCFYRGKIGNGANVLAPSYQGNVRVLNGDPYIYLHVDGKEEQGVGGSYRNEVEGLVVVELVCQICGASRESNWHSSDKLRIITFYQAQVALLKRLLRNKGLHDKVVVSTVDSSQGCEADYVLVSFVRSIASQGRASAGFLTDDRRMNVALTRARYQLICVGNVLCMKSLQGPETKTLQLLAEDAENRGVIQNYKKGNNPYAANQDSRQSELFCDNALVSNNSNKQSLYRPYYDSM